VGATGATGPAGSGATGATGAGATGATGPAAGGAALVFSPGVAIPQISQTSVVTTPGVDLELQSQASTAGAGTPGNILLKIPSSTGGNPGGFVKGIFGTASTPILALGPYNASNGSNIFALYAGGTSAGAPGAANYAFYSDESGPTRIQGFNEFDVVIGGAIDFVFTAAGLQLFAAAPAFGGGTGVLGIANATVVPTTNPVGGYIVYSQAGALKGRGSSGTITTIGPADPHCPECGKDFMHEWENPSYGYLAVCMSCLADELGQRSWILKSKPAPTHT
jgi:hypothetical protein